MMLSSADVGAAKRQTMVEELACREAEVVADSTEVELDRLAAPEGEVLALDLQQCKHYHYYYYTTTVQCPRWNFHCPSLESCALILLVTLGT